ncbi:hypothetical protein ACQEVC_18940 [Plantactinospora sp. CA-294935]
MTDIYLHDVPQLDLGPLPGNRRLTVWARTGQSFRNADGVQVRWH